MSDVKVKMTDIVVQDMLRRQRAIFENLSNPTISANRFNVESFKKDFLPYFSGRLKAPKEFLQAWANIAGDLKRPVILVNDSDEMVAIVPPFANTQIIDPLNVNRVKTADPQTLEASVAAQRVIAPNLAEKNLVNGLAKRFILSKKEDVTLEQQWLNLFAYFGITGPGQVPEEKKEQKPQLSFDDDDD